MFLSKLKVVTAWVVGVGLTVAGAGVIAGQAFADQPGRKPAEAAKPGVKPAEGAKPAEG